jgi:predicted cupin superfamily sugar epimerase
MNDTVAQIVERFELQPHPEGGYFREVYRSRESLEHPTIPPELGNRRRYASLIYFLLGPDDFSAFHRVRWSDEIWHLYAGGPIELHLIDEAGRYSQESIHRDLSSGAPTAVVPGGCWQAARVGHGSEWAFGGCTVAPGFEFADFEMPPRATLLHDFPQHADIIRALTRA